MSDPIVTAKMGSAPFNNPVRPDEMVGARGIAEHDVGWQFAKSPAWAPFKSDPEGAAMLRALGY